MVVFITKKEYLAHTAVGIFKLMKRIILTALLIITILSLGASEGLAGQVADLAERVERLEAMFETQQPHGNLSGQFTGTGCTQTSTFTVSKSPWKIEWEALVTRKASTNLGIHVYSATDSTYADGFGFRVSQGRTSGEAYSYLPPGRYYFKIDTGGYVEWAIDVK